MVLVIALLAVAMGLPTLGGGFVGGDDHRLLLNHVYVNHPSFDHAVKLFTVPHRDLYQPLPLLTFQIEFAITQKLGLFERDAPGGTWILALNNLLRRGHGLDPVDSLDPGALLFHFNNVLLHALNAVLVFFVVSMLHKRVTAPDPRSPVRIRAPWTIARSARNARIVAAVAAVIFAVHPLQTEVVAWTNGRMMLLSTLFALLSLRTFDAFLERPRLSAAVLTVLLVVLCSISKVRVGLVVLLMIVFLARRRAAPLPQGRRSALALWCVCTAVIGAFAVVNYYTTAGAELFTLGHEYLRGPRTVRVLMALSSYFQHLLIPVGLSSYYPTPPEVSWADPETLRAGIIVAVGLAVLGWAGYLSPVGRLGTLWFFSTIAITLPWMPARNILWADRYMYLPIIGLLWIMAAGGLEAYQRWIASSTVLRKVAGVAGAAAIAAGIAMCWHVGVTYATPLAKTLRVAELFPDVPRVWEPVGWTNYSLARKHETAGRSARAEAHYKKAIEAAEMELRHDASSVRAGALQLKGMSMLRLGRPEEALKLLHEAVETDPRSGVARHRLGRALDDLGRVSEAIHWYQESAELAPSYNPNLNRLGFAYRDVGLLDEARQSFQKALQNNPYEVTATMAMAEIDIQEGTPPSYRAAVRRLEGLLSWMPKNAEARINLGVAYVGLGEEKRAVEAYREALRHDPRNLTALLNLAQLYHASGENALAEDFFRRILEVGPQAFSEARAVDEFFFARRSTEALLELWSRFSERRPDLPLARAYRSWALAYSGRLADARNTANELLTSDDYGARALSLAALAYTDLAENRFEKAFQTCQALVQTKRFGAEARRRLLTALEHFDLEHPDLPWTFCLAAKLLIAEGNRDAAKVFINLCDQRCQDSLCRRHVRALRDELADNAKR